MVKKCCSWHGKEQAESKGGTGEGDKPIQAMSTMTRLFPSNPTPNRKQLCGPQIQFHSKGSTKEYMSLLRGHLNINHDTIIHTADQCVPLA